MVYEGMDYQTRATIETMCQGNFTNKSDGEAWAFLEDMAEKTMQWETIREDDCTRVGVNMVENSIGV